MANDGCRYRIGDQIYTYGELRAVTEADVADLPTETWRDGRFDDYLTESVHTGTIEVVEPDEDDDADDQDDDWRRRTKYLYSGHVATYDELRDEVRD
jgi:hypothetical protein